jgi:hypothetical protein
MPYIKTKSTTRFNFEVTRDPASHKAGSNVVTISTLPGESSKYSTGTTQLSMTVKEAKVLQGFLNSALEDGNIAVG